MTLGERIKQARKVAGISQEELAQKIGTRQSQVTRWETDQAEPRIGFLRKITEITGIPLSELMGENDNHEQ